MATSGRRGNREGSTPTQRADGRWQVHIRHTDEHGAPKRVTVYGKTPEEARKKARAVGKRLDAGQPARDRRVTLDAFATEWIGTALAASDRKATTRTMYAGATRTHIIGSRLGSTALDRLAPRQVEGWVVELRGKGLAPSTVRSAYTILRAILDTGVRDGALAVNPAAAIRRPKVPAREAEYLSPDQVRTLLAASDGSRYANLFALLVNTGLRRGEALALRWTDIDLERGVMRVRGTLARVDGALEVTDTKTEKSRRTVPLSPPTARVLRDIRAVQREDRVRAGSAWAGSPYVFTTELGHPCDPRNALRALKVAAKRAALPNIGLHTLRHSAASVMLSHGVPLKVVSEVLGHASVSITGDIYGHVSDEVAADALAKLGDVLTG